MDAQKAMGYVDWALLLLVGSALGLSKAIENSGLADFAGSAIRESGLSASASIYVLYAFTMVRGTTGRARSRSLCRVSRSLVSVGYSSESREGYPEGV